MFPWSRRMGLAEAGAYIGQDELRPACFGTRSSGSLVTQSLLGHPINSGAELPSHALVYRIGRPGEHR